MSDDEIQPLFWPLKTSINACLNRNQPGEFFRGNFQFWEEHTVVSRGRRCVSERDSLWWLEWLHGDFWLRKRERRRAEGNKGKYCIGEISLKIFFTYCLRKKRKEKESDLCFQRHECNISPHQLQDIFKFSVWSLYFDILFRARQYSLCLALASSATQWFLLQEWMSAMSKGW